MFGISVVTAEYVSLDDLPEDVRDRLESQSSDLDKWQLGKLCARNPALPYSYWIESRFLDVEPTLREHGWSRPHAPLMEFNRKLAELQQKRLNADLDNLSDSQREWLDQSSLEYAAIIDAMESQVNELEGICSAAFREAYRNPGQTVVVRNPKTGEEREVVVMPQRVGEDGKAFRKRRDLEMTRQCEDHPQWAIAQAWGISDSSLSRILNE